MHLRDLARQAWADAGLYRSADAKLAEFLKRFDADPAVCADDVETWLRGDYAPYLERLVTPLVATGDPLMRLVLVRRTDVTRAKETDLVKAFLKQADAARDRPTLEAVKALGHKGLSDAVARIERAAEEAKRKAALAALNLANAPPPARRKVPTGRRVAAKSTPQRSEPKSTPPGRHGRRHK